MTVRCAVYTRYSSDRQSPASTQDQLRRCREYADNQGWTVLPEHVYSDEEISGSGADRPGWLRLRTAIKTKPRPFDVLLVDDTSRLCRNLGESSSFADEARFLGLRVVAVSQGIDSVNKQAKVLMAIHGITDEMYIEELASKTHRGLEGRALQGLHTGGRCFGYDNVPVPEVVGADGTPAVRYEINEAEAGIVRRIFEMAADGLSLKAIAKTLNREHVPPPRKRQGRNNASWCPSAVREMLRRDLYRGLIVWNKSHFVKKPGTNKRLRRPRPESEWRKQERPELRIITEEIWGRVQQRIAFVGEKYSHGNRPGLAHRAATSPNLLTGVMKCGHCGANLIIVTGRGKAGHPRYGCPQNFSRGVCSNRVKQRADEIEKLLFAQLQDSVLRPEAIEYAIEGFRRQLDHALSGLDSKLGRMRQRASELQKELDNLAATMAACGPIPTLVKQMRQRNQELEQITSQLLTTEPGSVSAEVAKIRHFVTRQLSDIRQLLHVDPQKAKTELSKHVTEIKMVPETDGKKRYYVAEGEWNLLGGYGEDAGNSATKRIRMVAGGGFEPPVVRDIGYVSGKRRRWPEGGGVGGTGRTVHSDIGRKRGSRRSLLPCRQGAADSPLHVVSGSLPARCPCGH